MQIGKGETLKALSAGTPQRPAEKWEAPAKDRCSVGDLADGRTRRRSLTVNPRESQ
jgi:hypothetical protein